MIEYIRGELAELSPATAVIDCNGVGYAANISLNTYSAIQGKETCKLYIYEAIREDAYVLYGFAEKQEREIFLLLISVSGIGGNTARMILSALSPAELVNVISTENANLLKTVKGIGLKTAQRVIVDLKDKIKTMGASAAGGSAVGGMLLQAANAEVQEEAVAALTMLGFAATPSQKVVLAILKEEPEAPVEKVIKLALKRL
ncbi:Holliday junction branch migration protein RuvA [Bacteroides finegoldii]|uniref:Holliday junction branch migration protein RuvA n=1 Tax=Bacteroides finegoldii TaxID=338188 RepID=UPI0018A03821|nr:Holliday junction branch migration protein RuvA [Bacteroides finegoldii]